MEFSTCVIQSPLGPLLACEDGTAICSLQFCGTAPCSAGQPTPLLQALEVQLREYFAGERTCFTLPLSPKGTPFQKKVWAALLDIPYGETRSYSDIAAAIGSPKACRAVGMANNRNPIAILVPCHRVVGKNGALVGYAGGLELKQALLTLEQGAACPEHRLEEAPPFVL